MAKNFADAPINGAQAKARIAELEAERDALKAEAVRLRDLVRYCRQDLHEESLISDQEYAELTADSGSVARLASYDEIKADHDKFVSMLASVLDCRPENYYVRPAVAELSPQRGTVKLTLEQAKAIFDILESRAPLKPDHICGTDGMCDGACVDSAYYGQIAAPLASAIAAAEAKDEGMSKSCLRTRLKIYGAKRPAMWRKLRGNGAQIISTWIDEAEEGQTGNWTELWTLVRHEVESCERLGLYAEDSDLPLKGALIEVGMALALGKPVVVVSPDIPFDNLRAAGVGSWTAHPSVSTERNISYAVGLDAAAEAEKEGK